MNFFCRSLLLRPSGCTVGKTAHKPFTVARLLRSMLLIGTIWISGCPLVDPVVESFNNAITGLESQSGSWQATLQNLQTQLVAQGQSTLANEVQSVVNRGVASASLEFRCDVDFLGSQLAQALKNILASYQKKTLPGEPPHFCNVDPPVIDLSITPDRRQLLNIYGFNFSSGVIKVSVVDLQHNKTTTPPPGTLTLAISSEFLATLNTVNYTFSGTDTVVRFTLPGNETRDVNIKQPPTVGGVGQACAQPGNKCDAGSGCLAGVCTTCPPPFVPTTRESFRKDDEFAGNNLCGPAWSNCTNNWVKDYGGNCDSGYHREQCIVQILDQCDPGSNPPHCNASEITKQRSPTDCGCTVRFDTPNDTTKGIHVNIITTETQDARPRPQSCP
jgi:hypothetical protein